MSASTAFKRQFVFDRRLAFHIGVERECFITNTLGKIVPVAQRVLPALQQRRNGNTFTYELSACQLETRVGPSIFTELEHLLQSTNDDLTRILAACGFRPSYEEVAPETMPLNVYPDPRYEGLTASMPRKKLSAACRIIGTHIHIGMPDHATALQVYNSVREKTQKLIEMGDHSNGARMALYRQLLPDPFPPHLESWEHFYEFALQNNFTLDPRRWWSLVRISRHGTIEFRMFGATPDAREVARWAYYCQELCRKA